MATEQAIPVSKAAKTDTSADTIFKLKVPTDDAPTQPYFTRPSTEQAYYDLTTPEYRERSFAPWPLAAWAEFTFDPDSPSASARLSRPCSASPAPEAVFDPLVITPAIGVSINPEARLLPLDNSPLPDTAV